MKPHKISITKHNVNNLNKNTQNETNNDELFNTFLNIYNSNQESSNVTESLDNSIIEKLTEENKKLQQQQITMASQYTDLQNMIQNLQSQIQSSSSQNNQINKDNSKTYDDLGIAPTPGATYEPGSWENDKNNIYYDNCGGAVSVNTKELFITGEFFDEQVITKPNIYYEPESSYSEFGYSIATDSFGKFICVGTPKDNRVYKYEYHQIEKKWFIDTSYSMPNTFEPGNFGCSIDIAYPYLIIGDSNNSYIEIRDLTTNSNEPVYSYQGEPENTNFGFSVAIDSIYNSEPENTWNYSFITGDPIYNNIMTGINMNSNQIFNFNNFGTENTSQIGFSNDIKYINKDSLYFTSAAPYYDLFNDDSVIIENAGQISFSYYNISNQSQSNDILITSQDLNKNNLFGTQVKISSDCKLVAISSPGAYNNDGNSNTGIGNVEFYDISFSETNSIYNVSLLYNSDLSSNNQLIMFNNGSNVGQQMALTKINELNDIYGLTLGVANDNTGMMYKFNSNTSNIINRVKFPPNNYALDISYGSSIFYSSYDAEQSVLGISALGDESVYLYYNNDSTFNVKGNSTFNGSINVTDKIQAKQLILSDYSNVLGFSIGCFVIASGATYPLEAFSYPNINSSNISAAPWLSLWTGNSIGFFVYPGFKLEIISLSDSSITIDNTDGEEIKRTFWSNAAATGSNGTQIESIIMYKNNTRLIDCPYLVDAANGGSVDSNPYYTLSFP